MKSHSEEHKRKISERLSGRSDISVSVSKHWQNPDYRDRITKARLASKWPVVEISVGTDYAAIDLLTKVGRSSRVTVICSISGDAYTVSLRECKKNITRNGGVFIGLGKSERNRKARSASMCEVWADTAYKERITKHLNDIRPLSRSIEAIEKTRKYWSVAANREAHSNRLINLAGRLSSLQSMLYVVLEGLQIPFYRERENGEGDKELRIGPYAFDCGIRKPDGSLMLIECQGEYWHRGGRGGRDAAKATYAAKLGHEVKCLYEHQFYASKGIEGVVRHWLGINTYPAVDFDFKELEIKRVTVEQCMDTLSFHYMGGPGRGGCCYGAVHKGAVIVAVIFSPVLRQNTRTGDVPHARCRELSRLCIHPSYQKKNLASWFLSRVFRVVPSDWERIITYADKTQGHTGAVYKASNFVIDGETEPSYGYVHADGWIMHKKTLYNRAKKMKMVESEYAKLHSYTKLWDAGKYRYYYNLRSRAG